MIYTGGKFTRTPSLTVEGFERLWLVNQIVGLPKRSLAWVMQG